jgi:EAL domain-containing protein (putative c-di-GMP-specific phosphodiesterase class I)
VAYQPKVRIADGELAGVEALARWRRKSKGMVPPSYFVPLAERSGLIQELTDFVMHEALRQSRAWRGAGLPIDLSINMSPLTLTDLDIPEKLERLMWEMELEPRHLVIEVTETALMGDLVRSLDTLTRLRMKGFGLAIDDFGTGYSSMQHLVRAPFSELKIDRAFVSYIDRDDECKAVVNVSIALAHELGMTVVAEGVETERIYDMLRDMRCDEAQGFWLSRPFAGHKAIHWYNGWKEQLNSDSRIHAD